MYKYLGENEIMTIKENKAYRFTYKSPILEFDDLLPTAQKMIDSLNIMAMPPCKFIEDKESAYGGKCVL